MRCTLPLALAAVFLASLTGCKGHGYILPLGPDDRGPSTDQYRTEYEFVPNARMVTEDTSPTWELGRHAFERGTDRLFVISRVTSYADKDPENKNEIIPNTMRERKVERVWITIPGDVPLGKAVKLEDLESLKITGYDVSNLDGKGFFMGPHLMKGYITMTQESPEKAVAVFDIEIRPAARPFPAENWKVTGEITLPAYPDGKNATLTTTRDVAVAQKPADKPADPVTVDPAKPDPAKPDPAKPQDPGKNGAANPDNPAAKPADKPADKPEDKPADKVRNLAGKWYSANDAVDYHLQLDDNGKFIFAHTRGDRSNDNYAPGMNYGSYQVKKSSTAQWLVLVVDKLMYDEQDGTKDTYGNNPQLLMKVTWESDNLVLTGILPQNYGKDTKIVFAPATFQDMNEVKPPRGRRTAVLDPSK